MKPMAGSLNAVSTQPGQIVLTRILSGASSSASAVLKAITAPFDAEYAVTPGPPRFPAREDVLMIEPLPDLRRCGTAYFAPKKWARALTAKIASQSDAANSVTFPMR